MTEITICSVSFHNEGHLGLNADLMKRLNPGSQYRWVIVNNACDPISRINVADGSVEVLPGVEYDSLWTQPASYHHAMALNKAIKKVSTRFALVLDPDFYIVRERALEEITTYMTSRNLMFWGVPWHPKWYTKLRYFPAVHCLFIDMQQVDRSRVNFSPGGCASGGHSRIRGIVPKVVRRFLGRLLLDRRTVGKSKDTGYRLHSEFAQMGRDECATPVWRRNELGGGGRFALLSLYDRLGDMLLPDRFSYSPKKEGYCADTGFLQHDDQTTAGWEEFLWMDRPFGFHVRGFMKRDRNMHTELRAIHSTIKNLTND